MRIRIGVWQKDDSRGTVLVLPGRTEYIEKYAWVADELGKRGFSTLAIDWRGQGLADRLISDARVGHIEKFSDYQKDLSAALEVARQLGLPQPMHMIGHSMGGGIGLRAVIEGLPVNSCAFTGPMWGIRMSAVVRPFGWALSHAAPVLGMGSKLPPSTTYEHYLLLEPFEGNVLTTDPDMYELMRMQIERRPELALGGPSLVWLREALKETRYLAGLASPDLPCITFLGGNERIVDTQRVRDRMSAWPRGELDVIAGAEHEILMETPPTRAHVFERLDTLFSDASAASATNLHA